MSQEHGQWCKVMCGYDRPEAKAFVPYWMLYDKFLVDRAHKRAKRERRIPTCGVCGGTGKDPHVTLNRCPECRGSGQSTWPY